MPVQYSFFVNKIIRLLLLSDVWANLAAGMLIPIYAIFVETIGGDILDASWAYFSFMISSGLVIFLVSKWEDRMKHKEKLVVLGGMLASLGYLQYIFVHNQIGLIITQVVLGLSVSIRTPSYDALYSVHLDKNKEASEWGSWESMYFIVTAIAALLGGYVASTFGFKMLFSFMFLFSL